MHEKSIHHVLSAVNMWYLGIVLIDGGDSKTTESAGFVDISKSGGRFLEIGDCDGVMFLEEGLKVSIDHKGYLHFLHSLGKG